MGFGDFENICKDTALPLCSVIAAKGGNSTVRGILPECYARPVELANTLIFQIGNAFVHFGSLMVILIVIYNVRAKYSAIGRTEMLHFFYATIGLIVSSLVVDCGVAPPSSESYKYFVALQIALASVCCVSLMYNGIVCLQFWEDGSLRSMWGLRIVSVAWLIVTFLVLLGTFDDWASLKVNHTLAMFVVCYLVNVVFLLVYVVSQVVLVFVSLDSYWPLGAISLGVFFFVAGQVMAYVVNQDICNGTKHYIDGLFFASLCNIFAIMMVYKYWDMITAEDLEFSVQTIEGGDYEKRTGYLR